MRDARLSGSPFTLFGLLLRRYRQAVGLTQEDLAERTGVSRRSISNMERGVPHAPRPATIALLVEALTLDSADRLLFEAAARRLSSSCTVLAPVALSSSPLVDNSLPTPPAVFVGRARELALLESHLAGGHLPMLVLAGEPGMGKSRLLQEVAVRAIDHGLHVLAGGCEQRGGEQPYAPLLTALARHLRQMSHAQLRTALHDCAWLVRLLPELADAPIPPLPDWTLSPAQEQRLMFEAVARFLGNVAGPSGTLLVLDDLQWAGSDALQLLRVLAYRATEICLCIVGAYRDTEIDLADPLSVLLADLAQAGRVTQHTLGPLAPHEAAHLLAHLLEAKNDGGSAMLGLRAQLLQRAGGVPFFLVNATQGRHQERHVVGEASAEDGLGDLPWPVTQVLRQRVAVLPEVAREILAVAAVIGRETPHALLGAVVARAEEQVLAAVEAACRARLLEDAGAGGYRVAHDLIRELVEADLGTARRTVLHRRIAAALEQQRGVPAVDALAYHYAHTEEHARAAHWLERAAERAAAGFAHSAALEHYSAARERLVLCGAAAEVLSHLDEKLGDVRMLVGANAQAQEDFGRARRGEMMRAGAAARRADLWRKEGAAWVKLGDFSGALAAFAAAEEVGRQASAGLPADLQAQVELDRADVLYWQGEVTAMEKAVTRALALLERACLSPASARSRMHAAWLRVRAASGRGDAAQQEEWAQHMMTVSESSGDQQGIGRSWFSLAEVSWMRGDLTEAETRYRSALALLERVGDQEASAWCWRALGDIAWMRGDLAGAEICFQHTRAIMEQIGAPWGIAWSWEGLGLVAWGRGDLAQAEACYRRSLALRTHIGDQAHIHLSWFGLGAVALDQGDLRAATRWYRYGRQAGRRKGIFATEAEATLGQVRAYLLRGSARPHRRVAALLLDHARSLITRYKLADLAVQVALLTAEQHLCQGQHREAQEAGERALHLATGQARRREEAMTRRLLGQCALIRGGAAEAETHLRQALALQTQMGVALEAARTRLVLAEVLVAGAGRARIPEEVRTLSEHAQAQFAARGAALDLARAGQVTALWRGR